MYFKQLQIAISKWTITEMDFSVRGNERLKFFIPYVSIFKKVQPIHQSLPKRKCAKYYKHSCVYFFQACIRRWELVGRPWRLRWRDWTSCLKREAGLQELQVVPRPHLTGLTLPSGMAIINLLTYFLSNIIQQKSKVPKIFWPNSLGFGTNSIPSWHKNFKNRGLVTGTNSSILVCNMTFKE